MTATLTIDERNDRLPSVFGVRMSRGALELKQMVRQRDAVIFTFLFPLVLMVSFSAIFQSTIPGTDIDFRQYFIAGMIATGIMAATFVNVGIGIALERDDGTLKRLRGTPMRLSSYFIGKAVMVLAVTAVQVALLLLIGTLLFGLNLPTTPQRWLTLAWLLVLGVIACTLLGIAVSAVPRGGRSAATVVVLPFMVLQFISGVFFVSTQMPPAVQTAGALFPLKWLGQGLGSVFLPDTLQRVEPAGGWEHGTIALVLIAWIVGALIVSVATFRWHRARV
ncbi:ABC transporter permease [Saccharomonospora sp. NPDC046836]|uniref:ABC transporter permease n=1 Tax=Saccharomonospora sp. NPDC046836 TaxID=3156921 RepID=UPI0033D74210